MLLDVAPTTDLSKNKTSHTLEGDRIDWKHSTMSSNEAISVMDLIMRDVKPSCHIPMGDVFTILLVSAGYSVLEIKDLFQTLSRGDAGEKELNMMNAAGRRYLLKNSNT
jgi:hypothetical protein